MRVDVLGIVRSLLFVSEKTTGESFATGISRQRT
jgi:hypothetical protein